MQKSDIILVGLKPPPFHGQSIATGLLFDHDWTPLRVSKLEMRYSEQIKEIGRPSLSKVFHMFQLICRCHKLKRETSASVLYYTPTSASLVPFIRDIFFLLFCRPLFKRVILHYHAGGLPDFLNSNWLLRSIGRRIYGQNAWSVALTHKVAVPDQSFGASKKIIVANGVDVPNEVLSCQKQKSSHVQLLFVGNLYKTKGIEDAVLAASEAAQRTSKTITLNVMGAFPSQEMESRIRDLAGNAKCKVVFCGVCQGAEKWRLFRDSDILIFPSYYESENQPLVIFEAMAAGMPVIGSNWRGIPEQIRHGKTGYIEQPNDIPAFSDRILELVDDDDLRICMGKEARCVYSQNYTTSTYISNMETLFNLAVNH